MWRPADVAMLISHSMIRTPRGPNRERKDPSSSRRRGGRFADGAEAGQGVGLGGSDGGQEGIRGEAAVQEHDHAVV